MKTLSPIGFVLAGCILSGAAVSESTEEALWKTQPTLWELSQGVAITRAISAADPRWVPTRKD